MLGLEIGQAKVYKFEEKYKVILRKEKSYYCVVHPLTLEKIKLNVMGAFILDAYLSLKTKEDIIEILNDLFPSHQEKTRQWVDEFEGYLLEKKFIKV